MDAFFWLQTSYCICFTDVFGPFCYIFIIMGRFLGEKINEIPIIVVGCGPFDGKCSIVMKWD